MTSHAERIKAAHRGSSRAASASASRIAALNSFGLRYEWVDDFNVIVEGEYLLNLAMSYWRKIDGDICHGYPVSMLDAEIKRRNIERRAANIPPATRLLLIDTFSSNSPKPVAGRDSAAEAVSESHLASGSAESAAGASLDDIPLGSASLLPVVSP